MEEIWYGVGPIKFPLTKMIKGRINMLYTEFNLDEAKEVWHEEGYEEGIDAERQRFLDLINQGFSAEEIKQQLER